ncbi:hypothetical protein PanWU01x14_081900 [Parasponia andersonii]|uniref:Uncharacterized protein n=1 Tax=Parasponia andersonii TaxID=3476 RepID=A0A2P5DAF4_PARAD|nr:hypothetical protein PanWU01x14_081900 [Parasponia andersonii]
MPTFAMINSMARKMQRTSKDLLQFEHKNPSTSSLESTLRVCENASVSSQSKKTNPHGGPITVPVPQSQVLGKVKDFLGVLSEANKRLQLDAKDNSENYDIEVLSGNESQIIEMDLMLGIADLHTPEAVAAAESAIAGHQPVIPLAVSNGMESDDSSDEDNDSDDNDYELDSSDNHDEKTSFAKLKESQSAKDNSSNEVGKNKSRRQSKIPDMDICQ